MFLVSLPANCPSIILLSLMILRKNFTSTRAHSRLKGDEHRSLLSRIADLQHQNRELRTQLLLMQRRLLECNAAKRKYKGKYREAKQKIEILTIVGRQKNPFEACLSPRTKATRIKTFSSEQFNSIKVGQGSDFGQPVDTRVEIDHFHPFPPPRPTATPPTPTQRSGGRREDEKIMENLLKLHDQLDKLSLEIEKKPTVEKQVGLLEDQLYRKMEEVVDKVARMETRDLERENRRITHEKEQAARRYNASVKSVESIGKDLADFKVAP